MVAMFALTQTPLGRIANAVRDNPERAEFIGYNTQRVRWLMLILSSFFAGIAGGLSAINFEIVSAENFSAVRSGGVLLAAFIGGVGFFFGPILGAVVFVFFAVALSEWTKAWQLYLGVFFVLLVMFAPGGLSSLLLMNLRVLKFRKFGRLRDPYVGVRGVAGVGARGSAADRDDLSRHAETGQGPVARLFGIRNRHIARRVLGAGRGSCCCRRARLRVLPAPLQAERWDEIAGRNRRLDPRQPNMSAHRLGEAAHDTDATVHALELAGVRKSFGRTEIIRGVDLAGPARRTARDHRA